MIANVTNINQNSNEVDVSTLSQTAYHNEKNSYRIANHQRPGHEKHESIRKKNMTEMNQRKRLNYRFLTWDLHIKNVAVFHMFVSIQYSPYLGQ